MSPRPLLFLGLLLAACQPPPKDIIVVRRGAQLLVDLKPSFWDVFGGPDRSYAMGTLELFDRERIVWRLDATENIRGEISFPIVLGAARPGYRPTGRLALQRDVQYAVGTSGIGTGRVDFVLEGTPAQPRNITDRQQQIDGPCGSYWGPICPEPGEAP